jgi:hypothetical protein
LVFANFGLTMRKQWLSMGAMISQCAHWESQYAHSTLLLKLRILWSLTMHRQILCTFSLCNIYVPNWTYTATSKPTLKRTTLKQKRSYEPLVLVCHVVLFLAVEGTLAPVCGMARAPTKKTRNVSFRQLHHWPSWKCTKILKAVVTGWKSCSHLRTLLMGLILASALVNQNVTAPLMMNVLTPKQAPVHSTPWTPKCNSYRHAATVVYQL